ncbi:genetic competence negative regulator [Halobacillus sp. A5]|uniref:genetic competence negative regulator n=1 Tax=Halobacillus sp. A5 TaxID=2880263 RepID=UPI0020A687B5|nr:genetic competence negative regulator [Halobacillus sp. A5]MCP3025831.1 genetic competence negative regulator [Halobacillus sp. A5]
MRVERMSNEKFKIFLTFDDLLDRGLTKEELWSDLPRVHRVFSDMMYDAGVELGVELNGMLLVQVYLLQAQGMLVVVTKSKEEIDEDDGYIEMKVTLDESKEMIFAFDDFEDIIQAGLHLYALNVEEGDVYLYNDHYYMVLDDEAIFHLDIEQVIALLSEFSSASAVTSHRLIEYGQPIMKQNAVKTIKQYFSKS